MRENSYLLSLFFLMLLFSCMDGTEEIPCTAEFRTIGVTVHGDSLTNFYTIRNTTSDTIRFSGSNEYPYTNWYPILDDDHVALISESQEVFIFIGEINDTVVVEESYTIKADKCHVSKVAGKEEVDI